MAELQNAAKFAIYVAIGITSILEPLLDFIDGGATPLSPVLREAVALVLATLPFVYFIGIMLVLLQVAPAAARRFACLACAMVPALLLVVTVLLVAVWLLAGGGQCGGRTHPIPT